MKVGDRVQLRIVSEPSNGRVRVENVDTGKEGVLVLKNRLKLDSAGIVRNAWVLQCLPNGDNAVYGNSFFGRWDIRPQLQAEYLRIIGVLYKTPDEIKPEEISTLKGMFNRCLKHDQWDWHTTYTFLGSPKAFLLRKFVADALCIRDELRNGNRTHVQEFAEQYRFPLSSMQFNLTRISKAGELDTTIPPPSLSKTFWSNLLEDSRRNILIVEHCLDETSQFLLMHFFVTLETEFRQKLVVPFQESLGDLAGKLSCYEKSEQLTHDVLVGRSDMTLGTIDFLGHYLSRPDHLICSESIRRYKQFIGSNVRDFIKLCSDIGKAKVANVRLRDLRNKIAHGDISMLGDAKTINSAVMQLWEIMLSEEHGFLERIISLSLKRNDAASEADNN